MNGSFPFHRLPTELRRLIVETVVTYCPENAPLLLTTCTEIHTWIEPSLYHHVTILSKTKAERFVSSNGQRTDDRIQTKSLCVAHSVPLELALKVLQLCKRLERLALWSAGRHRQVYRAVSHLPLTSLSISIEQIIPESDPDFSLLPNVTYLKISDLSQNWENWSWKGISSLTNLTHLSLDNFDDTDPFPSLKRLLSACNSGLEVCVLRFDFGNYEIMKESSPGGMGRKFVMLVYSEPVANWTRHVKREEDDWAKAKRIVMGRPVNWAG